jgi:hypothetical protein
LILFLSRPEISGSPDPLPQSIDRRTSSSMALRNQT